jgi:hypothetical protein
VILDLCSFSHLVGGASAVSELTAKCLKGAIAGVVQFH